LPIFWAVMLSSASRIFNATGVLRIFLERRENVCENLLLNGW
jgi:hypothetical protein